MADGSFRFAGSVFWFGKDNPETGKAEPVYAVTAKHVIDGIRRTGVDEVWFRINQTDGNSAWLRSNLNEWFFHPTDASLDVAILKTGLRPEWDHLVLPYSLCMTDERMTEHEVALGDEVFVTGLFRHHHGTRRNIPIVRVGNLACLTEEKVETNGFGLMDAFLIEARSIGGLSGSPVFLNLGVTRMIGGQVKHARGEPIFYLLGLIHGHYDVATEEVDEADLVAEDALTTDRVNTGIAIVSPFHSIMAVIEAYEGKHS